MLDPTTRIHLIHALNDIAEQARATAWRAETSLAAWPAIAPRLRLIAQEVDRSAETLRAPYS